MSIRSLGWRYLPRPLLTAYADRSILRLPDRVYLANIIIPTLLARRPRKLLNVGVHYYTHRMQSTIARAGVDVFTADPDGRKSRWGVPGSHRVCAVEDLDLHFAEEPFDAVLLNGVLGYGLDSWRQIERSWRAIAKVLNPEGLLVIGWDDNMICDPLASETWREHFCLDTILLQGGRSGHPNGMADADGKPARKYFDVLRRNHEKSEGAALP